MSLFFPFFIILLIFVFTKEVQYNRRSLIYEKKNKILFVIANGPSIRVSL